ncbi:MAG: (2Fe-2S)-binding protein, partial [Pseudobdellovibrio sp.]
SRVTATGNLNLLNLLNQKINTEGSDPKNWSQFETIQNEDEALLNQFIIKLQAREISSEHDEICHCRMVDREKIENAIYQGCKTREDISTTTLAGTGCGSCRGDLEKILSRILKTS